MSTYFADKIKYILEELDISPFEFQECIDELSTILYDGDKPLWNMISQLTIIIQIKSPNFILVEKIYEEGKIKSHELDALIEYISQSLRNSINSLVTQFEFSLNQYTPLRQSISIRHSEEFEQKEDKYPYRIDNIILGFNTKRLSFRDVIALVRLWNFGKLNFAEKINIYGDCCYKDTSKKDSIFNLEVGRRDSYRGLSKDILIQITKLLAHPTYQEILSAFIFPHSHNEHTEITLDVLKKGKFLVKRRSISFNGASMKFHEILTKETPNSEFKRIIQENDIVGFYISTKSVNNTLLYFIIDIDVPPILYHMFPHETVWKFTLSITRAISKVASRFGLPPFKVHYSGKKGVHLLWSADKDIIVDVEKYVNLPELFDYTVTPGLRSLKKEKLSTINDQFKFTKTLLQALLLYTVYRGTIEIPREIRLKFHINHPYQLFSISTERKNLFSILLDCSSQGRGVFRLYSPHPLSQRVSIPISEGNKIVERYESFENVKEDAKIEIVLEKLNSYEIKLYQPLSSGITRAHIRELLRPDRLFSAISILLRFGTMYAIRRSHFSFSFWHRFFELKKFYSYVEEISFNYNGENIDDFMKYIENMGARLHIIHIDTILSLLYSYIQDKKISFAIFSQQLSILYQIEFFFELKSDIFLQEEDTHITKLLSNGMNFRMFLDQVIHIFEISANTIIHYGILNDIENLSEEQQSCLQEFHTQVSLLIDMTRSFLDDIKYSKDTQDKERFLIDAICLISRLYFSGIMFVREFYEIIYEKVISR